MGNPWLDHVKEFKKQHPGISHSEALHHAKSTYKKVSGGSGLGSKLRKANKIAQTGSKVYNNNKKMIDGAVGEKGAKMLSKGDKTYNTANKIAGGSLVNKARKANKIARAGSKVYNNNKKVIDGFVGERGANLLSKGDKTYRTVSNGVAGGSLVTKVNQARRLARAGNQLYDNNKELISSVAGENVVNRMDKGRAVSGVMSGGKFKFKARHLKKGINTVSKIGAPMAMLSGRPGLAMGLSATGSLTEEQSGGSFKAPGSRGGALRSRTSRASRVPTNKEAGNLMKYAYLYTRPPPPSLRSRAESIN